VQTAPDFADAHFNLATALEHLGSQRQAVGHLRRYIDLAADGGEELTPWVEERWPGWSGSRLERSLPAADVQRSSSRSCSLPQ